MKILYLRHQDASAGLETRYFLRQAQNYCIQNQVPYWANNSYAVRIQTNVASKGSSDAWRQFGRTITMITSNFKGCKCSGFGTYSNTSSVEILLSEWSLVYFLSSKQNQCAIITPHNVKDILLPSLSLVHSKWNALWNWKYDLWQVHCTQKNVIIQLEKSINMFNKHDIYKNFFLLVPMLWIYSSWNHIIQINLIYHII